MDKQTEAYIDGVRYVLAVAYYAEEVVAEKVEVTWLGEVLF